MMCRRNSSLDNTLVLPALIGMDYEDLSVPIHGGRDDNAKDASVYEVFSHGRATFCRRVSIPFSQDRIRFQVGMLWDAKAINHLQRVPFSPRTLVRRSHGASVRSPGIHIVENALTVSV
jgi:hypothetical protein